ncbi:MAG TPA: hypothetical protein VMW57_00035 [Methyloceanibacter sp.]|nr:hypothetical protein [Methyloceanibacter sp.]
MIPVYTVNLPACVFGAGLAHAAALALVLPMMITLPAPSESSTAKLVAIPVEIVAASGAPSAADLIGALMDDAGEGDADPDPADNFADIPADLPDDAPADGRADGADEVTAALPQDVTGALPAPSLTEAPPAADLPGDSGMEADARDVPQEEPEPASTELANVDAVLPPLPIRVRRDDAGEAILQSRPVPREPVPQAKPVHRAVPAPKRGLFGLAQPRAPVAKTGDAAPYQGSWESLLGKPAH